MIDFSKYLNCCMEDLNLSDIVERSRLLIEETKQHLAKLDLMNNLGPELAMTAMSPVFDSTDETVPETPSPDVPSTSGYSE